MLNLALARQAIDNRLTFRHRSVTHLVRHGHPLTQKQYQLVPDENPHSRNIFLKLQLKSKQNLLV